MTNKEYLKNLKREAIILLIAAFSMVGVIACGGADVTSSVSGGNTITIPDDTGPGTEDDGTQEPEQPTFDKGTYYKLYVPWTTWRQGSGWITNVSWQDTNTITQLWKEQIDGGKRNDGNRWMIRDGDNRQSDPRTGNYYYFDKNFDIVHAGKYANGVKVKQFLGGVIVKYSGGRDGGKTWSVGGLYRYLLNKSENNSQGQQGYTKYENDNLNEFMRAIHAWNESDLTVIVMNVTSGDDQWQNEFGVDEYYCTVDNNYRKNPEYFLGKDPKTYVGTSQNGWSGEKLNVRVNHSWKIWGGFQFRFFFGRPYKWHLE